MVSKITEAIEKFKLNLSGKTVLTEAASGNYVVTPIIAALAGAKVIAIAKASRFATIEEVKRQTYSLAKELISKLRSQRSYDLQRETGLTFYRPSNMENLRQLNGTIWKERYQVEILVGYYDNYEIDTLRIDTLNWELSFIEE